MSGIDALKSLHTALIDAAEGYDKAIEDTEYVETRAAFEKMLTIHENAHSEIDAMLRAKGEVADESGSFMGTVHKTVIAVRSATTGLGHDSLASFADGEEHIVKAYDEAIDENRDEATIVGQLARQKEQLQGMIVRMREASVSSNEIPS